MKTIYRFLLVILGLCLNLSISEAQTSASGVLVLEEKITRVNSDPITGLKIDPIKKDWSNRPCARIKLHVNRMSPEDIAEIQVRPIGGSAVVMKSIPAVEGNGLIIEVTAKDPLRFYINHPQFGDSNPVSVSLEGNVEYRMEASCNFLQTIVVSCPRSGASVWLDDKFVGLISNEDNALSVSDVMMGSHHLKVSFGDEISEQDIVVDETKVFFRANLESAARFQQYVVFHTEPHEALVTLDGDLLPSDMNGNAQRLVKYGLHEYVVEAKDYHTISGSFIMNSSNASETRKISVKLNPAFGYLKVTGKNLDGARIYVDKEFKGVVPMDSIKLSSGIHQMNLVKPLYRDLSMPVQIYDARQQSISPQMLPDFAKVTIIVPDNAEIYINDEFKSRGSWTGDLASSTYQIEARAENHISTFKTLTVFPGMSTDAVKMPGPIPVLGTLSVESEPLGADVFIDGKAAGQTPLYKTDVLTGHRKVKIVKDGYVAFNQDVKVLEGEIQNVKADLISTRTVNFKCVQKGAILYVDGELKGSADGKYELSYGKHEIKVECYGYDTWKEKIDINQDTSLDVNISLSSNGTYPQAGNDEPYHKPVKKPLGWLTGDDYRRPMGLNLGVGFDYETDYRFKENSYGVKFLCSLGNYKNRFNLEGGVRFQFWDSFPSGVEHENIHEDPWGDEETSQSEVYDKLQYRIMLIPKYNFVRKSSSSPFYAYTALELSFNIFPATVTNLNEANFSTAIRLGAGFKNYDFSLYWLYDVSRMFSNEINPASYHRSRVGFGMNFYLF